MVHRRPTGLADDAPLVEVDDTQRGLSDLARAARARVEAGIVAVTGSVGKTGTKEMLRVALSAEGATHATTGNLNNHWGVPLTLARMPGLSRYAVFELGMNHPGEIEPLSMMVRPQVAIITAVDSEHPPLNLVLGAPVLKMARDKLATLAAELDRWEAVTLSADYRA